MPEVLLNVDSVTKIYRLGGLFTGTTFKAVSEVSFSLIKTRPEVFTIIGESGSGKTTLSLMILRRQLPDSGAIHLNGTDIASLRGRRQELDYMRLIQPIFQNPFESFNPLNKIDHYLFATAQNFFQDNDDRVETALKSVGLSLKEVRGRYPHELSGGQLQRIAIARAIIPQPTILVADEPVSMVDASLRMSIVNLFKDLKEHLGTSIIYITHDLATAYYISDRLAIMHRGVFVEQGEAQEILLRPHHPYTRLLVDSVLDPKPGKAGFAHQPAGLEKDEYVVQGCKFAPRCPLVRDRCRVETPEPTGDETHLVRCFAAADEARTHQASQSSRN